MLDSSSIFLVFFLSFKIADTFIFIYMGKLKMCKKHFSSLHSLHNMTLHPPQGDTIHITYKIHE